MFTWNYLREMSIKSFLRKWPKFYSLLQRVYYCFRRFIDKDLSSISKIVWVLITFFSLLFITLQFSGMSNVLSQHMENAAIISSYSSDAGTAIAVARSTSFFNDNRWRPYGPVYYRVVHSLFSINQQLLVPNLEDPRQEQREAKLYFYLMLVSVLSIIGISYLIGYFLATSWQLRLLSTAILSATFLSQKLWVTLIWWAHPDILLAFLAGCFNFYVVKKFLTQNQCQNQDLVGLGIIGGIGLSTKFSFGLFLLPASFLWIFPLNKVSIKNIIIFYSTVIGTFFLIGFPQNFKLQEIFAFVQEAKNYASSPTFETMSHWCAILISTIIPPLIALAVLTMAFATQSNPCPNQIRFRNLIKFIPFWVGSWIILMSLNLNRAVNCDVNYYILPFIAFSLIFFAFIFRCIANIALFRIPGIAKNFWKLSGPLALIIFALIEIQWVSPTVIANSTDWIKDRNVIRQIYSFGLQTYNEKKFVLRDPYVPFPNVSNSTILSKKSAERFIKSGKAHFLMLSSKWYYRFLKDAPNAYDVAGWSDNPLGEEDWFYMQDFYKDLVFSKGISTVMGKSYKRIFQKDSIQIWEAVN